MQRASHCLRVWPHGPRREQQSNLRPHAFQAHWLRFQKAHRRQIECAKGKTRKNGRKRTSTLRSEELGLCEKQPKFVIKQNNHQHGRLHEGNDRQQPTAKPNLPFEIKKQQSFHPEQHRPVLPNQSAPRNNSKLRNLPTKGQTPYQNKNAKAHRRP